MTDWSQYGPCGRPANRGCGVAAGKPCKDGRSQPTDASRAWYPQLTKSKPCRTRKKVAASQ